MPPPSAPSSESHAARTPPPLAPRARTRTASSRTHLQQNNLPAVPIEFYRAFGGLRRWGMAGNRLGKTLSEDVGRMAELEGLEL